LNATKTFIQTFPKRHIMFVFHSCNYLFVFHFLLIDLLFMTKIVYLFSILHKSMAHHHPRTHMFDLLATFVLQSSKFLLTSISTIQLYCDQFPHDKANNPNLSLMTKIPSYCIRSINLLQLWLEFYW
jgi:hypothetical protein